MTYTATNQTLSTLITNNNDSQPVGPIDDVNLNAYGTGFSDFRLDAVRHQQLLRRQRSMATSTLAHGVVDNFVVTMPPPPIQNLTNTF